MKYSLCFLFIFSFTCSNCIAQLQMSNWIVGGNGKKILSFKEAPTQLVPLNKNISVRGSQVTYSDKHGNFKYLSNGFYMYNKNLVKMKNGTINLSSYLWKTNWIDYGMPLHGGGGFLEDPASDTLLYFIYTSIGTDGKIGNDTVIGPHKDKLYCLKINMNNDSILFKDSLILSIPQTNPAFVRHANGKDWWIVTGEYYKTNYRIFKLTDTGILESKIQTIGQYVSDSLADCRGWVEFSMDGSKYCRCYSYDGIQVMNFDRCKGEFSNPVFVPLKKEKWFQGHGANISPNNRFLYSTNRDAILQFDLWSDDIVGSMDTIAFFDLFSSTDFSYGAYGIDGKLYYKAWDGIFHIHVLDRPNLKGKLANFRNHAKELTSIESYVGPPIFINYKLGVTEPPCDE